MKKAIIWLSGMCALALALLACAPAAAPSPPSPAPAPAAPSAAPALSPEEASWAKVVAAAKKEGRVNAYSFSWVGDVGLAVAKAFNDRYGISVDIITGRGAEFTERIKTERRMGQQVADMTQGSVLLINNMKVDGLLASVAGELPILRDKDVWWVHPTGLDPQDKALLVWSVVDFTPYINTRLVKPGEAPQSWKDLLDPKWKGKMSLTEPNIGAGVYQYIVVLMDNKAWDEDYIRALYRQNLRFYNALPDELTALARGDNLLAIRGSDSDAGRIAQEGAPIQAIDMKEGVILSSGGVAAISGGPNPNASRLFLNWILSPEGQTVAGKAQGRKMVRRDVPDFRPKAAQASITRPLPERIEHLDKATRLFREKWFDKLVGR